MSQDRGEYSYPPRYIDHQSHVESEVKKLSDHPVLAGSKDMIEYMQPVVIGEVVEQARSEQFEPSQSVLLGRHDAALYLKGELSPIAYQKLSLKKGYVIEGGVLARVTVGDQADRCDVMQGLDGRVELVTIDQQGRVLRTAELQAVRQSIRAGSGTVQVERTEGEWRMSYEADPEHTQQATLSIAESTAIVEQSTEHATQRAYEKRARRLRWTKRAIAAAAIYATLTPGGLIDHTMDPFVDTEQTVQSIVDERFEFADKEQLAAAGETVEQIMGDLDDHRYDAILDRAAEYRQGNADKFMTAEQITELYDALDKAGSKQEVDTALKSLEAFYGYDFIPSEQVSFDAFKYTATEVVDALVVLPKHFTDQAVLESIHFDTPEEVNVSQTPGSQVRWAYYAPSDDEIHMSSRDQVASTWTDLTTSVPGFGDGYNVQSLFIHEFAHALSDGIGRIGTPDLDRVGEANTVRTIAEDAFMGGLLNSPQVISNYARTSGEESLAENMSGILSNRTDGLAHPDNARRFISPANQTMLEGLIALEMADPGFANYIVAQNERLMQGKVLGS